VIEGSVTAQSLAERKGERVRCVKRARAIKKPAVARANTRPARPAGVNANDTK
jgi:hypothetical protein